MANARANADAIVIEHREETHNRHFLAMMTTDGL